MIAAFITSSLFLVCYIVYHAHWDGAVHAAGFVRPLYFTILATHVTLAATVLPLALVTLSRGLKGRYPQHIRIARWTLPIWLYVSVTGRPGLRAAVPAHLADSNSGSGLPGSIYTGAMGRTFWLRCCSPALAGNAAAQGGGRVTGVVKDDHGGPIKGATIIAENPDASPSIFTANADAKGRFAIIGLKSGCGR